MRHKKDDDKVMESLGRRVHDRIRSMPEPEAKKYVDDAQNLTFNEATAKIREMEKLVTKPRRTEAEFETLVKVSALIYAYVLLCRGVVRRVGGFGYSEALIQVFRIGGDQ